MATQKQKPQSFPDAVSVDESEEIFAMTVDDKRNRLSSLLYNRWMELLKSDTPVSRRVRTLCTCAALKETRQLAEYALQSDEDGGNKSRGEMMLSDVVQEAESLLTLDRALRLRPSLVESIRKAMPIGKSDDSEKPQSRSARIALEHFTSLLSHAEKEYIGLCEESLLSHFNEKGSLVWFEETLEQLASHARSLGWSDEGLIKLMQKTVTDSSGAEDQIKLLCALLRASPTKYHCEVDVILCEPSTIDIFNQPDHGVISIRSGSCSKLSVEVVATDPWTAAENAYYRVGTIVGAPNVFQKEPNSLPESSVLVSNLGELTQVNVERGIIRDHHNPWKKQIEKIVSLASDSGNESTLYEAIRNHHRALNATDVQTAYTLLWAGIERICANPKRMEPILTSTADLVSAAMALSKIRREVQNFAEALTQYLAARKTNSGVDLIHISDDVVREVHEVVPHKTVLAALIGSNDDAKKFCTPFYDDVKMVQWFFRLRRQFAPPGGTSSVDYLKKHVPDIIESSRRRTRWQMLRLYRARNHLAHGACRTLWLSDLARHANYLLTNVIAICLNYAHEPCLSARSILERRSGWLNAYISLCKEGDSKALSVEGLLKPSSLFD